MIFKLFLLELPQTVEYFTKQLHNMEVTVKVLVCISFVSTFDVLDTVLLA